MKGPILGWDVGGANLKAARIEDGSQSGATVIERPFPLWRERHGLPAILAGTAERLGGARNMAVTMTAELADCFATKREGVVVRARRLPHGVSRRRAVDLRDRWTISIGGSGAATTASDRGRQLEGERDVRGAHVSRRDLPRRGQHDDRRDPDRRGPRGRPRADGSGPAAHRRARLHGSPAHAGVRHRALRAAAWPSVPSRGRALRRRRRRPSVAGANRRR